MTPGRAGDGVATWLSAFQDAVAAQDVDAGRELFSDDVQAYGTRTAEMSGLDTLVSRQWRPVWTQTHGFHFTDVDYRRRVGSCYVVAVRWESHSASGRSRRGRCTLVLSGDPLRCVHSHFSMVPLDGGRLQ